MKIHLISDIHLEFNDYNYSPPDCDVVVLSGDICPGEYGIMWAAETFKDQEIIYIAGNHEFYEDKILSDHYKTMANIASDLNIHFLQNQSVIIDGVRFVGCTLWTDFALYGNQPLAMLKASNSMNDYTNIFKDGYTRIIPDDILGEHKLSIDFLKSELSNKFGGKTVVVTHHGPSEISTVPDYKNHPMNPSYVSSLDRLIEVLQPTVWFHGHIHQARDYVIDNTRVVVNPRGYGYENTGFNDQLIVNI